MNMFRYTVPSSYIPAHKRLCGEKKTRPILMYLPRSQMMCTTSHMDRVAFYIFGYYCTVVLDGMSNPGILKDL
jgi:hypothetical protein